MIAVIPAAGIGQRMEASLPKQYLQCAGETLLDHSIAAILAEPRISKIFLALHENDHWFANSRFADHEQIQVVQGGASRAESVVNALSAAINTFPSDTLVAVHDAARPGLPLKLFSELLDVVNENPEQGALLALPVHDTVKYSTEKEAAANGGLTQTKDAGIGRNIVNKTLVRDHIWLAQTPQVFRLGDLQKALSLAAEQGNDITDEASAMETLGAQPILVPGSKKLLKVTTPDDLALIEFYLTTEQNEAR
ncbi:2-C-methyl-D-erythritol 4-phosphate cytidylyltransferase [Aliidiomarina iranensis]|uniref:2-C-methyl-D-erythritol 4-phosphate cytidylyltransferase n=1 Tax=Aliidiomarina iranensis TaxID=1434071 RepID=A0A432W0F3_9GAMM|nr:2-C-methyl-D-erythritol 4-phosphate cytidylyltransferase [Aliidiomarina iranensis]RUO22504.1 2-C-methyl-D-erythritol 4-phosphate cytidylyltransferase [Aliidiomarina iranensis]